ncbi:MAG TPA: hypothetical protein VND93_01330 [Myxococcales bacterium]|nr:hypothetical protein [Myxococcales bacterium]
MTSDCPEGCCMHDLDHTMLELAEPEGPNGDFAMEGYPDSFEGPMDDAVGAEAETGLDESEEMALASEVLGINDDREMEYFLGGLLKKLASKAGQALHSTTGQALVGLLKNAAKKALPKAGAALGTMIGGPFGTMVGSQLATKAGQVLGLELEGLSPEDQELESARQFVRLAGSAARNLFNSPGGPPMQAAASALSRAARTYAPGLLRGYRRYGHGPIITGGGQGSGRWVRRGNTIIIYGV